MDKKGMFYDKIEAYLIGQLSEAERSAMEKAMQADAALAREVALRRVEFEAAEAVIADDIRAQFAALRNTGPMPVNENQPAPPNTTEQPLRRVVLIALGIALGLLGIVLLGKIFQQKPSNKNEKQTIPTLQDSTPLPQKQQTTPTLPPDKPVANIQRTPTKTTPDRLALAGEYYKRPDFETLRSGQSSSLSPIEIALDTLEKGGYMAAIRILEPIPPQDPAYWKSKYLTGHALYLERKYGAASNVFLAIVAGQQQPWAEESEWFAVLSLMAAGKTANKDFTALLGKVATDKGHTYQAEAAALQAALGSH